MKSQFKSELTAMMETYFIYPNADGVVKFPETIKYNCKILILHLFQTRQFPLKSSFYNKGTRLPGLCLQAPLTFHLVCSGNRQARLLHGTGIFRIL